MLKVTGDVDLAVPTVGTLGWIKSLDMDVVKGRRRFEFDGQVAGFTTKYDGLTLVIVKGAGHMVPADKPEVALHVLTKWINDEKI